MSIFKNREIPSRVLHILIGVAIGVGIGIPVASEIIARREQQRIHQQAPDIKLKNRESGDYHLPTADREYDLHDGMSPPTTNLREGL